ncbi:homoserine O-succinyltransferase [soil metagenome]
MSKASGTLTVHFDSPHFGTGPASRRDRTPSQSGAPFRKSSHRLTIGLVNNMPDSAFEATERQFTRLVAQAGGEALKLRLYYLPSVPRGAEAQSVIAARYRHIEDLYRAPVDALIVTGTEPRTASLKDEPYWPELANLIDWARDNTASTVWSCLAAHAAVLHLDGIARLRLPSKRSGAFFAKRAAGSMILDGLPSRLCVCHSRLNEIVRDDLVASGYRIVSESPGGHVDIFTKAAPSAFVFLQGHPEYNADSLMREYRRDVGRYLQGERDQYPDMPENYFDAETIRRMEALRERATISRNPALFAAFPEATLRRGLANRLRESASAVFKSWLAIAAEQKVSA